MIPEFEHLQEEEVSLLFKAPVLVSILIAGADGKIDKSEMKKAISVSKMKQSRAREGLIEFYSIVGKSFEQDMNDMINGLPAGAEERTADVTNELKKLNLILPKLARGFAIKYYGSLKDIAKQVAEASGGVLGYLSVSYEEAKLMDLKMINDPSKLK